MTEAAFRKAESTEPKQAAAVEPEKTETRTDREALGKAVEQIQAAASIVDVSLQFRIDEASNQVQVVVMNKDTQEVIREIPGTEVLRAAARLKELIGLLIDTTA
jgi:flagellar protein FlaG